MYARQPLSCPHSTQDQLKSSYWNRQIERWMDLFSDDEPDLMGLELVREFDSLTKYFYTSSDEDMNQWTEESSEIYVGIRNEIMTGETI